MDNVVHRLKAYKFVHKNNNNKKAQPSHRRTTNSHCTLRCEIQKKKEKYTGDKKNIQNVVMFSFVHCTLSTSKFFNLTTFYKDNVRILLHEEENFQKKKLE